MSRQSGFTLLETVLVLGVVGIIVGAVWLAYSTANDMKRNAIGEQQITDLIQAARSYLLQANENSGCTADYYGVGCASDQGNDITQKLIDKKMVPASTPGTTINPFTNTVAIAVEYGGASIRAYSSRQNPNGSGPVIGIGITHELSFLKTDCINLISTWGGSASRVRASGLIGIDPFDNNLAINGNAGGSNQLNYYSGSSMTSVSMNSTACYAFDIYGDGPFNMYFRLNP